MKIPQIHLIIPDWIDSCYNLSCARQIELLWISTEREFSYNSHFIQICSNAGKMSILNQIIRIFANIDSVFGIFHELG